MRYIRKHVLSLSHGSAAKMLTYKQFYTVPDFFHNAADGDTRSCSNTNLVTTTNFNASHAREYAERFAPNFPLEPLMLIYILE